MWLRRQSKFFDCTYFCVRIVRVSVLQKAGVVIFKGKYGMDAEANVRVREMKCGCVVECM